MTAIERAARAIWEISGKPYHPQDIIAGMQVPDALPDWERFIPQVRAVLNAIREPSVGMIIACSDLPGSQQEMWARSIDAALEEG